MGPRQEQEEIDLYCSNCGAQLRAGSVFCAACGQRQPLGHEASPPASEERPPQFNDIGSAIGASDPIPTPLEPSETPGAKSALRNRFLPLLAIVLVIAAAAGATSGYFLADRQANAEALPIPQSVETSDEILATGTLGNETVSTAVDCTSTSIQETTSTALQTTTTSELTTTSTQRAPTTTSVPSTTSSSSTSSSTTTTLSAEKRLGVDLTPGPWSDSHVPDLANAVPAFETGLAPASGDFAGAASLADNGIRVFDEASTMLWAVNNDNFFMASQSVTRDFYRKYHAVFFTRDCLTLQGDMILVGARVEGAKVEVLGSFTIRGGATSSAVILEGARNGQGAAVLYRFRIWPPS